MKNKTTLTTTTTIIVKMFDGNGLASKNDKPLPELMLTQITDTYMQQWASYQIRKIAGCACARNAGNVSPHCRFQRKPLVSDPGMHHGTCVTHVPWCMSGSLTCGDGENVPGIPGACAPAILRIWQEAHRGWWVKVCILAKGYEYKSF